MRRHGSPADRGSADAYYWRSPKPHYFKGATYQSEMVEEKDMTPEEIREYMEAFNSETDRKDWGFESYPGDEPDQYDDDTNAIEGD